MRVYTVQHEDKPALIVKVIVRDIAALQNHCYTVLDWNGYNILQVSSTPEALELEICKRLLIRELAYKKLAGATNPLYTLETALKNASEECKQLINKEVIQ